MAPKTRPRREGGGDRDMTSAPPGVARRQAERQRADREHQVDRVSEALRRRAQSNERPWIATLESGRTPFPRRAAERLG
jgi:hypothetical protein